MIKTANGHADIPTVDIDRTHRRSWAVSASGRTPGHRMTCVDVHPRERHVRREFPARRLGMKIRGDKLTANAYYPVTATATTSFVGLQAGAATLMVPRLWSRVTTVLRSPTPAPLDGTDDP